MCGIIGRIGMNNNPLKTLNSLKKLEYRGYDSYGILINNKLIKDIGEISLIKIDELKNIESNIEIGHTRWATHGGVFQRNAHPHFDNKKKFFIVMNGIVENYLEIKNKLINNGIKFNSDTDTEIIVQLFSYLFDGKLISTLKKILIKLKGEFSFLLKYENKVLGYKNINPMIIGNCEDEIFIGSDLNIIQNECNEYYVLEDEEFFICEKFENEVNLKVYDTNYKLKNTKFIKSGYVKEDDNNDYIYFMEEEIFEQKNLKKLLTNENILNVKKLISNLGNKEIILTAAGTSYHASLYMHYTLLELGFNSQCILASELSNYINVINDSLIIVFSQSGETADLIYPLKELNNRNKIFAIINTKNSTIDRMAEKSIYLNCGIEIGVASTKAFTFQIGVSKMIFYEIKNKNLLIKLNKFENDLNKCIHENEDIIDEIIDRFVNTNSLFFIGRDKYYPLAIEGALKLKEISYIHAEGFAGGELKHGTLALIEDGIGCIVLGEGAEIISNTTEIKTRGGIIIGISENKNLVFDYHLKIPKYLKSIFMSVLMQRIAFKMTLKLGYSPDRPRNLAKSVTVK